MKGTALILFCAFALALGEEEVQLNAVGCPLNFTIHKVLPHDTYCNLFYSCERGIQVLQNCPGELVFNAEYDVCDWKLNVDCGEKEIYEIEEVEEEDKEVINPGGNNDPSLAPEICARENSTGVLVAHENCTQFYKCDDGAPSPVDCPEGLLYNSELGYCDWPANVECGKRILPEKIDTDVLPESNIGDHQPAVYEACARDYTNELLLAHKNCNRFYKCSYGLPVTFSCPSGLVYNIELRLCDWQTNVECGNRPIVEDEKEEEEDKNGNSNEDSYGGHGHSDPSEAPAICAADKSDGVLVAHENCYQFYKCWRGTPVTLDCPFKLLYNPEQEICDWSQNVDCGVRNKSS